MDHKAIHAFTPAVLVLVLVRLRPLCPAVSAQQLITDPIFVKGDVVTDSPFDWKGELSALKFEACGGSRLSLSNC